LIGGRTAPDIMQLYNERFAKNEEPACTAVCPRKAVVFGRRKEL
jgi:Fe-S-cluster-containing dehydrogenase component